jgi:hypothetical protein
LFVLRLKEEVRVAAIAHRLEDTSGVVRARIRPKAPLWLWTSSEPSPCSRAGRKAPNSIGRGCGTLLSGPGR